MLTFGGLAAILYLGAHGLPKPWLSKNEARALRAVAKLENQKHLLAAAGNLQLRGSVRVAAAGKLNHHADQVVLAGIAKRDADGAVRRAAVARLSDQRALADVALHAGDPAIREAAAAKVADPRLLANPRPQFSLKG